MEYQEFLALACEMAPAGFDVVSVHGRTRPSKDFVTGEIGTVDVWDIDLESRRNGFACIVVNQSIPDDRMRGELDKQMQLVSRAARGRKARP